MSSQKQITILNSSEEFKPSFTKAAEQAGQAIDFIDAKDCVLVTGYTNESPTIILHDGIVMPLEQTRLFIKRYKASSYITYLIARIWEKSNSIFSDQANLEHSNQADKMTVTLLLPFENLPVPKSIVCTPHSFRLNQAWLEDHIEYPCVLKKTGSKGQQVWKVESKDKLIELLNQDDKTTLIQEYLPNNHDFRVFVVDGEVITVIRRNTADGFYNNISQGGNAEHAEITEEEKQMCIVATKASGLRIAGVDFVRYKNKPYIFEVNKNPEMSIFNEAAGFDIEVAVSERVIRALQAD